MNNWLTEKVHGFMVFLGRYRLIKDRIGQNPYLMRYYIFLKERDKFPFNIFIHKFLCSDPDDFHDHPWDFISIPLYPGYFEHTLEGCQWRGPLHIKYAKAEYLHRVELGPKQYCWTIFIPFRRKREWGFKMKDGWVNNADYLVQKYKELKMFRRI